MKLFGRTVGEAQGGPSHTRRTSSSQTDPNRSHRKVAVRRVPLGSGHDDREETEHESNSYARPVSRSRTDSTEAESHTDAASKVEPRFPHPSKLCVVLVRPSGTRTLDHLIKSEFADPRTTMHDKASARDSEGW